MSRDQNFQYPLCREYERLATDMEELKHKTENLFLDYHAAWDKLNKEKNDLALEKAIVSSLREVKG